MIPMDIIEWVIYLGDKRNPPGQCLRLLHPKPSAGDTRLSSNRKISMSSRTGSQ